MAEYFALEDALAAGLTPADIVPALADRNNYDYQAARQAGVTDEQIIATLMGETGFSASMKRFINAGGSSIKGLVDLAGGLNKERALAERTAANIASANAPVAGFVGELGGAIADPITLPAFAVKGLKAATLVGTMAKQGAAQGALGGFLEPVLTEEESRLMNTVKGTAVGTVFGAGIGKASQGVINFLEKKAIKAAGEDATAAAIDDVAKAIDVPPSREAQPVTATQAPVDYNVPAYLRRAEAEGLPSAVKEPLDPVQIKLVEDRIAKTEAEVAKHEADLAKVQQQQPEKDVGDFLGLKEPTKVPTEKQVAALFKAPEGENLPAKFGLVAPTPEAPAKQVAALFKSAAPSEVPVIKQQIVEAAKQGTAQEYLVKQIEAKKLEVERLKGMIAPPVKEFPIQVETRQGATPQQVVARDARVQQVLERTGRTEPVPTEAPLTAAQTQQLASLQKVLDDNGFKNVDEAIVASGRPDEVAAAQARIDAGTPQTPIQAVRGFQSGGAAATPRELVYAESVPFATNAEKLLTGGQKRGANVEPPSANEQWNDLFSKAIGVLGAKGRQLRGRGEFGGSLEGTMKAGEKAAARMQREEGSIEDWVFKQNDDGTFPNIDKSWNRAEVEAFRPVYEEARATLSANLSEINRLRDAGELTDAALQTLTYRSQLPIGILGIYQGQRTKASDTLNAFKLAKSQFEAGKEVKGLFQPGVDCQ